MKMTIKKCEICNRKLKGMSALYLHLSRTHGEKKEWQTAYRRAGGNIKNVNPATAEIAKSKKKRKYVRKEKVQTRKYTKRISVIPIQIKKYCSYCGLKLEYREVVYCYQCGEKLEYASA